MSNYCASCRYNPARATGDDACPFTTLYWDFLMRKEGRLKRNPRLRMQFRNLERMGRADLQAIRREAEGQRSRWGG
jgi:deoxyribodipyrimidine photolyase-related protein